MRIVISSGHGKYVRGASGIIDEVDEARKVVEQVASWLRLAGHHVVTYHDDVSTTQGENLDRIVDFHNSETRDLDVSVHFNAYTPTDGERGCEVLYLTQEALAYKLSEVISTAGEFINRGAHKRTDLAFLNGTSAPAVLLEICFVDAAGDCEKYNLHFEEICRKLGSAASEPFEVSFSGKCSHFGGPADMGVDADEGLAFLYEVEDAPHLFLEEQPSGTTGLARRLDPATFYVACRWDYDVTSKEMLRDQSLLALVRAKKTGRKFYAWPADWGPMKIRTAWRTSRPA